MPSKSKSQANLMKAVAHDPGFAKRAGIPQRVGKEFANADAGIEAKHMAGRKASGATYSSLAHEFGTSKTGAHRKVKQHEAMRHGFNNLGPAK